MLINENVTLFQCIKLTAHAEKGKVL